MEIHPLEGGIHSLKQFLLHLLTITVGILIALGLETSVQWAHHRALVREAQANLAAEIQENQRELETRLQQVEDTKRELREIAMFTRDMRSGPKEQSKRVTLGWRLAELHSTSWDTANATGAAAYMDYDTVKRYTEIYDRQKQFLTVQDRGLQASLDLNGIFGAAFRPAFQIKESARPTDYELREIQRATAMTMVDAAAVQQIGQRLLANYDKFKSER